jgi:hypothetical protein
LKPQKYATDANVVVPGALIRKLTLNVSIVK